MICRMMTNLRAFGAMCRRRWRLIAAVSGVLMLLFAFAARPQPRPYRIEIGFIAGQAPLESTLSVEEERYFNWVASEYIVFGLADWANGTQFADRVQRLLALDGIELDLDAILEALDAGATRSRLVVAAEHVDPATVRALIAAAAEVVMAQDGVNIPQLTNATPRIFPIDNLAGLATLPLERDDLTIRDQLNLPLLLLFGFLGGFALAGVLELFDPTIRSRSALQGLNLPLLGEIPEG